jgi:hypothetical protein
VMNATLLLSFMTVSLLFPNVVQLRQAPALRQTV